jgi:hypothetical protein
MSWVTANDDSGAARPRHPSLALIGHSDALSRWKQMDQDQVAATPAPSSEPRAVKKRWQPSAPSTVSRQWGQPPAPAPAAAAEGPHRAAHRAKATTVVQGGDEVTLGSVSAATPIMREGGQVTHAANAGASPPVVRHRHRHRERHCQCSATPSCASTASF